MPDEIILGDQGPEHHGKGVNTPAILDEKSIATLEKRIPEIVSASYPADIRTQRALSSLLQFITERVVYDQLALNNSTKPLTWKEVITGFEGYASKDKNDISSHYELLSDNEMLQFSLADTPANSLTMATFGDMNDKTRMGTICDLAANVAHAMREIEIDTQSRQSGQGIG